MDLQNVFSMFCINHLAIFQGSQTAMFGELHFVKNDKGSFLKM